MNLKIHSKCHCVMNKCMFLTTAKQNRHDMGSFPRHGTYFNISDILEVHVYEMSSTHIVSYALRIDMDLNV